jgi:hypothetical protein
MSRNSAPPALTAPVLRQLAHEIAAYPARTADAAALVAWARDRLLTLADSARAPEPALCARCGIEAHSRLRDMTRMDERSRAFN